MEVSDFFYQAFVTLFVIADPFGIVPVFASLTTHDSEETKLHIARRCVFIGFTLLLIFAFAGDNLLDALHISEPAFRITGGFLLLLAAIDMVMARGEVLRSPNKDEEKEIRQRDDVAVFPLAIPLISGPGALTCVVVLMRQAQEYTIWHEFCIAGAILVVVSLIYISLRTSSYLMRFMGISGMNVATRIFGVILSALAIQNMISGIIDLIKHH